MRIFNNQTTAANVTAPLPFSGLGFATDSVQEAAQGMVLIPHCHSGSSGIALPAPDPVAQPSGYMLLVTLGREIRGR